jgi:hypothetical protein
VSTVVETFENDQPAVATGGKVVVPYEQRLKENGRWALNEGGLHFERDSAVHKAMRRIAKRLDELNIPYAVAGGMALFKHGYRRFTDDVDIVVTRESLDRIHAELEGRGYVPPFTKSKNLRDTDSGVKIEFLVAGQFPGDGKPKPIAFPDPADVALSIDGIQVVNLPTLLEMKLASGMTGAGRRKDIGDVQEVIKELRLPANYAEQLNPYVRSLFQELHAEIDRGSTAPDQLSD